MVIFLTGASGFIGRHLARGLTLAGHEVVCAVRHPAHAHCRRSVSVDFTSEWDPGTWVPRLAGIDIVINAVGILRESHGQSFQAIHVRAPQALFAACVTAGVPRVIQISALGAEAAARSRYHLSKWQADEFLAGLPLDWTILQPSLVFGCDGTSAGLFTTLASLPIIPVPGRGEQMIQPIHIDDLVAAVLALTRTPTPQRVVPLVGTRPLSLRDFLRTLRMQLERGRARFVGVPLAAVRTAARLGAHLRASLLDPETLDMLVRGNTADVAATRALLGREPRAPERFLAADTASVLRQQASLRWIMPILRWSIALVWIATGIVSLWVYPREASLELLARTGVPAALAPLMLYGAAALDLALGVATIALRGRRWLWLAQGALIVYYTIIISVFLPEYWAHPYGPLLKNLPLLAAIMLLHHLERR